MSIKKKIFISLSILIVVSLIIIGIVSYFDIKNIRKETIAQYEHKMKSLYTEKINAKNQVGLTNAIELARNKYVIEALEKNDRNIAIKGLKPLIDDFKKYTKFKDAKIHIHDKNVHSFVRLWKLNKYGDNLSSFRKTILWVKENKRPLFANEVGRAGLVIRGLAPVIKDGEYIGSVEFIQNFNTVVKYLYKKYGLLSVVTLKSEFSKNASFINKDKKIGNLIIFGKYSSGLKDDLQHN